MLHRILTPPGSACWLQADLHDWQGRGQGSLAGLQEKSTNQRERSVRESQWSQGRVMGAYLLFMSFFNTTILLWPCPLIQTTYAKTYTRLSSGKEEKNTLTFGRVGLLCCFSHTRLRTQWMPTGFLCAFFSFTNSRVELLHSHQSWAIRTHKTVLKVLITLIMSTVALGLKSRNFPHQSTYSQAFCTISSEAEHPLSQMLSIRGILDLGVFAYT